MKTEINISTIPMITRAIFQREITSSFRPFPLPEEAFPPFVLLVVFAFVFVFVFVFAM